MPTTLRIKSANKGRKSMVVKIVISIIALALAAGILFGIIYIFQFREYKNKISDIMISKVNLSEIPDGSYVGSYDALMVAAKVQVDVSDHSIKDIHILYHKNERGKNAEKIINEIKSAQSLQVDTISGATNSSKVILKAVQNALDSGLKE